MRPVWFVVCSDCDIKLYLHFYIIFNQIENCQSWQKCVTCHQNLAVTKIVATIKWRLTTSTKLSFILDGKKFMPIHEALCATIWNIWYFLVTKEFFEDKRRMTQKNYNLLRIRTISYCIKLSQGHQHFSKCQSVLALFISFRKSQV